jgi:methylglutaconyl-CoA hydratase
MTTQESASVLVQHAGGVLTLVLNRPERRNALNGEVVQSLTEQFVAARTDSAIRVIVIRAAGEAFSAGVDLARLRALATASREEHIADAEALCRMLEAVLRVPQPVVAIVQGSTHGGAVGLVAACDVVVAAESAVFATAEVRVGLAPALLAPYLASAIGPRAARYHLLTGEVIDAQAALRLGLVNKVVAREALDDTANGLLRLLRRGGPFAMGATKRLFADGAAIPLDDAAIRQAAELVATVRAGAEAREGVAAFLEKRPAAWTSTT